MSVKPKSNPVVAVVIEVRGDHKESGKTVIAAIILRALKAFGFTAVEVVNKDGDLEHIDRRINDIDDLPFLDNPVHIVDNNTPLKELPDGCDQ